MSILQERCGKPHSCKSIPMSLIVLATIVFAMPVITVADEPIAIDHVTEIGMVPRPDHHAGRDVGFSVMIEGRSLWIFGDTFPESVPPGQLAWRSSSWSWTEDLDLGDGVGPFRHAVDDHGVAIQLLPHTPEEERFNLDHDGNPGCRAESNCGARLTPWPGAAVSHAGRTVVFYGNMRTGSGGPWDFNTVSSSVALWEDPQAPATRIEPPLFTGEEPPWGAAAVIQGEHVLVFACPSSQGKSPCQLARAPLIGVHDRERFQFWSGASGWQEDWRSAATLFDGSPLFSVHYNPFLDRWLAIYMDGLDGDMVLRTAPDPTGPWSKPQWFGRGVPSDESFDYALITHPEFSQDNGRTLLLSYNRPAGFLTQEIRLVELRFGSVEPFGNH